MDIQALIAAARAELETLAANGLSAGLHRVLDALLGIHEAAYNGAPETPATPPETRKDQAAQ